MLDALVIILAGLIGGMLNSIAGGGSFITLPALMLIGFSPITANATGTVALLSGYVASVWHSRHTIRKLPNNLTPYVIASLLGGMCGALILNWSDEKHFDRLLPWLMLLSTLAFIIGPKITLLKTNAIRHQYLQHFLILFAICLYGGYFNGGVGIMLLAGLSIMTNTDIHNSNAIKNLMSVMLTTIASLFYWMADLIDFNLLFMMGISALFGGYLGSRLSYSLSQKNFRVIIIFLGCVMTLIYFNR
ncbi:sulfite exporter TauE/SafE family protein [Methylophaga sulfidovorans]|uniref:Probable membrane transporter protein n=2 Tax=Methylophaga TaxID=40222 RepID=A0A1I4C578_9GAMM|nr:sulfite exporter TauE/SafE family protein [Methylophaga sulfidovorans]SFK75459.1 hypothetical protein SAMN04488079_12412 [Methylophaga sulfidovorans]